MNIVLKWRNYNSAGQAYTSFDIINAEDKAEVDEILECVENKGLKHPNHHSDHSLEPAGFSQAGGFYSELIIVTDRAGNNVAPIVEGWYGRPIGED
jgi:hypothetical protein